MHHAAKDLSKYVGDFIPYGQLPVWKQPGFDHFKGMVEEFFKECGDALDTIEGEGIKMKAISKKGYAIYTSGFCSKIVK